MPSRGVAATGTRSCGSSPCGGPALFWKPSDRPAKGFLKDFPLALSPCPPAPALPSTPDPRPSPGANRPAPALCAQAPGVSFAFETSFIYLLLAGLGLGCCAGFLQLWRAGPGRRRGFRWGGFCSWGDWALEDGPGSCGGSVTRPK